MKTTRQKLKKIPGRPGLLRHESGTYYMRRKIKGQIYQESLGVSDRKVAERKLEARTEEIKKPPPPPIQVDPPTLTAPTLKFFCDLFTKAGSRNRQATQDNYEWVINRLRTGFPKFKEPIDSIESSDISSFWPTLAHMKSRSQNDFGDIMGQIFEVAVADGYLAKNTVKVAPNIRRKVKRERRHIPTVEEFQLIVDHISSRPFSDTAEVSADFITFYTLFAVGEAEATRLDWSDVKWEVRQVHFKRVKPTSGAKAFGLVSVTS